MRTQNSLSRILSFVSLAGLMAAAACGGGGGTKADLEMKPDLSAPTQGTSCATLLGCAEEAGTSATAIEACVNAATPAAQATFAAIDTCAREACLVVPDGGSTADGGGAPCSSATDTSAACVACATATAPTDCTSQIAACTAS
jgi:hypothetical protein